MKKFAVKQLLCVVVALVWTLTASAKVSLHPIFGDNMVLQRECQVRIWGEADANAKVVLKASWEKRSVSHTATADSDGRWSMMVPTPQAGGPYEVRVECGADKVEIGNVLIGEVWLCSGQSNMEMPIKGFNNQMVEESAKTIMGAKERVPIRMCTLKHFTAKTPQYACRTNGWLTNTPESVATTSATAYFFAKHLQEILEVPVGVIISAWGGTMVESWMSQQRLAEFEGIDLSHLANGNKEERPQDKPAMIYNGMIAPLEPFTIKGFLWYQGESNRHNPEQYRWLMKSFAEQLREGWGSEALPFFYVQIAPYKYDGPDMFSGAMIREAQMHNLKDIPNSGMVVTMDIGDAWCIHPAKKSEVGQRLAWLALTDTYGHKYIYSHSPVYEGVRFSGGKAYVTFDVEGLCLGPYGHNVEGFEIAGEDRVFYPAKASTQRAKNSVVVHAHEVPNPVAVRYCFKNVAEATVFNNFGLPVSPFRTDDWPIAPLAK